MSRNKFYVVLLTVCFGIWGCSNGNEPVQNVNTLDEWYIGAVPGYSGTLIVDFKSKPGEVGVFMYKSDDTEPGKMYRWVEYTGYTVKGNSITLEGVELPYNTDIRYTTDSDTLRITVVISGGTVDTPVTIEAPATKENYFEKILLYTDVYYSRSDSTNLTWDAQIRKEEEGEFFLVGWWPSEPEKVSGGGVCCHFEVNGTGIVWCDSVLLPWGYRESSNETGLFIILPESLFSSFPENEDLPQITEEIWLERQRY